MPGHSLPRVTEVYAEFDLDYLSLGRAATDSYIGELNVALAWQGKEDESSETQINKGPEAETPSPKLYLCEV